MPRARPAPRLIPFGGWNGSRRWHRLVRVNLSREKVCGGLVVLILPFALAACGGGGGSSSSSKDLSSANYDPAETTLKDAGLEPCSEAQTQIPQSLASGPGVQNSRAFFIAK